MAGAEAGAACSTGAASEAAAAAGAALDSGTRTTMVGLTAVPGCCADDVGAGAAGGWLAGCDCATVAGGRGDALVAAGAAGA